MPYSSVRHITHRIMNFYPYKIQAAQQLEWHDSDTLKTFALEFLARIAADGSSPWNILWTDEIYFYLNGPMSVHNCRIWARLYFHEVYAKHLYDTKVTTWCRFTSAFIINTIFV